jgi:hypothetical protein
MKRKYIIFIGLLSIIILLAISIVFPLQKQAKMERRAAYLRCVYWGLQNVMMWKARGGGCLPDKGKMWIPSEKYPDAIVSWRYEIGSLYLRGGDESYEYWHEDEPWNSPFNIKASSNNPLISSKKKYAIGGSSPAASFFIEQFFGIDVLRE